jgi:FAD/FMN-containing dehydrogenase
VGDDETAMGGRDAVHTLYAFSMWEDPTESDTHIVWAREFMGAMEPFTIPGVSLYFSADHRENKIKAFFGPEKYERLVALKDKYDPVNLFRLNQNIKPSQELPHPVS